MFEELIKKLLESAEKGDWTLAAVIVGLAVVVKLPAILEFFERRRNEQDEFIKEALKHDLVVGATRSFLEEELNQRVFKRAIGMSANRKFREKASEVIDLAAGELSISDFAKAKAHIALKDGRFIFSLSLGDKVGYWFNWALSAFLVLYALILLSLPMAIKGLSFFQFFVFWLLGLAVLLFAMFVASETIPYATAMRIRPVVERVQN